jgi:SNF2 family DNA or RNA helicase
MDYLIPPWAHQLEAIGRAAPRNYFGLFFEQGTGKTSTAINILRHLYDVKGRVLGTLIFCPPVVIPNWKAEFKKYSKVEQGRIILLQGPQVKRINLLSQAYEKYGANFIAVTNYEALQMEGLVQEIKKTLGPEVLIFDESHKIKNHQAKRTKIALKLAAHANYRYLLSGTPVLNSAMDLFSQFQAMDLGENFGKNFYGFRARYFYDANAAMPKHVHFPDWRIKPNSHTEINRIISSAGMVVKKSECLDLPPLVRQVIPVELSPDQKRLYVEMRRDFITYLNGQTFVAELAITKALRLMQIVSGYCRSEEMEVSLSDTPRMAALRELLEVITPNHKVLVWAVFKENFKQIAKVCQDLGIKYVEVHGEISPAQKQKNVESFNNDPGTRVFIGHPGSGGIGINLVAASYSIWFSRNFSLEFDLQAEARNYRGGSEIHEKITRIDLVAPDTIDEIVVEKLSSKEQISSELLTSLKDLL